MALILDIPPGEIACPMAKLTPDTLGALSPRDCSGRRSSGRDLGSHWLSAYLGFPAGPRSGVSTGEVTRVTLTSPHRIDPPPYPIDTKGFSSCYCD